MGWCRHWFAHHDTQGSASEPNSLYADVDGSLLLAVLAMLLHGTNESFVGSKAESACTLYDCQGMERWNKKIKTGHFGEYSTNITVSYVEVNSKNIKLLVQILEICILIILIELILSNLVKF